MQCIYYLLLLAVTDTVHTISTGENDFEVEESSEENNGCPPWSNGTDCQCGSDLGGWVHCDEHTHITSLLSCYCMTYDNITGVTVGGSLYCCFTNFKYTVQNYFQVPQNISDLNEAMCGHFNRQGRLCGQCKEGFLYPVYSYDLHCINCTYSRYNWVKYVASAFGPLTVFFLTVIIFSISPTNSPILNGFVFTCQMIGSAQVVRIFLAATDGNTNGTDSNNSAYTLTRVLTSFYGIWNLDFLRTLLPPICLPLTSLQVIALDYAIAFYPLFLITVAYILVELHTCGFKPVTRLWQPFSKCFIRFTRQWNLKTSLVDTFAIFLLLSYVKVASVSFDLLLPTTLYNVQGEKRETRYLYYDASVEYFGKDHFPYAILALLILLVFNVFPLLLLLLYPCQCFQRCLTHLRVRSLALKIFMDAFQGCYKDGTAGTRDHRYFSAVYVGTRLLLFIIYILTLNSYSWSLISMVFAIVSISCTIFEPYKSSTHNLIDPIAFFVIALWGFSIQALNIAHLAAPHFVIFSYFLTCVLSTAPLLYITGVFFHWFIYKKKFPQKILKKVRIVNRSSGLEDTLPDRLVNPEQYERLLPDPVEDESYNSCSDDGSATY